MRRFSRQPKPAAAAEDSSSFNEASAGTVFDAYADPEDPLWMNMEGIANMVGDLGLDAESDVRVLVLCWKLKSAEKPGEIKRDEFLAGMREMGVDSKAALKTKLASLDTGFMEHREFREFYRFCFKFNREDIQKKTLEKEMVIAYLPMIVGSRSCFTDQYIEFLKSAPISRISSDEWNSFLEFSKEFESGIDKYEDDGAWPTLLDDFVDWLRAKKIN